MLVAVMLLNLIAATQDIATDGLAVALLAPAERGLANGVQVAGYRVGMIIGGGALLGVYDASGWTRTFAGDGRAHRAAPRCRCCCARARAGRGAADRPRSGALPPSARARGA